MDSRSKLSRFLELRFLLDFADSLLDELLLVLLELQVVRPVPILVLNLLDETPRELLSVGVELLDLVETMAARASARALSF